MPLPILDGPLPSPSVRDSVNGLSISDSPPTIVSISDLHGYLEPARSALLTLADHPEFAPVVVPGDDEALGFPLPRVADSNGVVCETIAGTDVVVFATDDGIHAFEDPGYEFEPGTDGEFYADSTTWNGATGEAADGPQLIRLPARRLFAFAWQDDHGPDAFFQS
ncbi:DUF3179 domain-containing protein [Natronosalvus halobius]|nr:DUF3179 domain-containing protein [Natronosalvus halobius]